MVSEGSEVTGGAAGGSASGAPKGRRFAAALVDLLIIPIILGVVAGVVLIAVPDSLRNIVLVAINVLWLVVRDMFFSPGRMLVGLKLESTKGSRVTLLQAVIRNVTIGIPFVLTAGYPCEIARIFLSSLLWRRISYAIILLLALLGGGSALIAAEVGILVKIGAVAAILVPPLYLVKDKAGLSEGDRLADVFAGTRVVSA
jgi:uncharacterized RDD family membrane protein YckC